MTQPATVQQAYRRELSQHGRPIAIRRYDGVGPARTFTDTTVRARVRFYSPQDLVGTIQQGDRQVIMLVEDAAAIMPITPSDKVVLDGRELAIFAVDDATRAVGATLIAIELQVRG